MPESLDLHHTVHGPPEGPALVLLHGFPLSREMWRHQVDAFSRAGWRVIVPDLRGHGRTPVGNGATSIGEMAGDVARLVRTLSLSGFALGGFSMGGYIALQVARDMPERVRGLALVCTRAGPDTDEARKARVELAARVRREGVRVVADAMLPKMLTEATRRERPELAAEVHGMMMRTPQEGAAQALLAMAERPDQRPHLGELRMPALVVAAAEDPVMPMESAHRLSKGLPHAKLEVVPHAAHLAPMERPEAVNAALLAWLKTLG
jgi:pimeloyl-ACP methyl ester carboxylesterase